MKPCIVTYLNKLKAYDNRTYLLNLIKYTVSPTIDGIKPGTLMVFRKNKDRDLYTEWMTNRDGIKSSLNIDFYQLKLTEKSVHVLFYKPYLLNKVLSNEKNIRFLSRFGYEKSTSLEASLERLSRRYSSICPHEIGIFLGYPIDDVLDFIYPSKKECLMKGYWKVYNDLERAKETFNSYDDSKYKVYKEVLKMPLKTS